MVPQERLGDRRADADFRGSAGADVGFQRRARIHERSDAVPSTSAQAAEQLAYSSSSVIALIQRL